VPVGCHDVAVPVDIEQLLHRRSDLSTFLVHLTRDAIGGPTARQNLLSILTARKIEARSTFGMATALTDAAIVATQRCVCLTETPLEQVWMMTQDISQRQVRLQPYGVALTKVVGRRRGANPVWYVDITPGHDWLTVPINRLVELARRGESRTIDSPPGDVSGPILQNPAPAHDPILQLAPFIEQMGPIGNGSKKEFWWEREWRKVGDLSLGPPTFSGIVAAFVPEADHNAFLTDLSAALGQQVDWVDRRLPLLDPHWGLERMIARLANIDDGDAGPFTS
jgi:hypothetical protein